MSFDLNNSWNGPHQRAQNPGNVLDRLDTLETLVTALFGRDTEVVSLSDLAEDLGIIVAGQFLAGVGDPFDTSGDNPYTGAAMLYPGVTIGIDDYNLVGMLNGVLEFGISSSDGKGYFAGGRGIIDATGLTLAADVWPSTTYLQWKAVDTGGVVGSITVAYAGAAVNTGVIVEGFAHDVAVRGYVALWASSFAGVVSSFVIDSNATATLDFTNTTVGVGGSGLRIDTRTSGTNVLNNVLYLGSESSGATAVGFGSAIAFYAEDASGAEVSNGYMGVQFVTVTAGIADSKATLGMIRKGVSFGVSPGGSYADHVPNAGNITTGETDLYSDTLIANLLAETGDKIVAEYTCFCLGHATATRQIRVYFGGAVMYDTGAFTLATGAAINIRLTVLRSGPTSTRAWTSVTTDIAGPPKTAFVNGLPTLSNSQIIKITGQAGAAGAATNDILARGGYVSFLPAA